MKVRDLAILSFPTTEDLSEKDGYVVIADAGNAGSVKLADSATAKVAGVITTPADGSIDLVGVAVPGFGGTVRMKLGGTVAAFDTLTLKADGTVEANGTGTVVGKALEAGVAEELVEATLTVEQSAIIATVAALDARVGVLEAG